MVATLVVLGLAIAGYSGYSDHEDSVLTSSLKEGQDFTKGQLSAIGKMLDSPNLQTGNDLKERPEKLTNDNRGLAAKKAQIAAYDWQRLQPFEIGDLRNRFARLGHYPVSVVWGSDGSSYGLAVDPGDACRDARWTACTPEKLPDSVEAIGITVHWQAGYQPIAKAIADSLKGVIGVPVVAAPVPESNLKESLEVMVGRKPL